jgi:hypothetical protein
MAKPAQLPEWATDGSADIVEPNLGKKILGWIGGERPPAQVVNWLHRTTHEWIEFLAGPRIHHVHGRLADNGLLTATMNGVDGVLFSAADGEVAVYPLLIAEETVIRSVTVNFSTSNVSGDTLLVELLAAGGVEDDNTFADPLDVGDHTWSGIDYEIGPTIKQGYALRFTKQGTGDDLRIDGVRVTTDSLPV